MSCPRSSGCNELSLKKDAMPQECQESIVFKHALAEGTGLPDSSIDLVSACLIFHEVPASGIKAILTEAFRILRPGGCLGIMVGANDACQRITTSVILGLEMLL